MLTCVSHKSQIQLFEKVLCLHLWAWIGGDKKGKSALFSVQAKETEALFLQVSLHEYLPHVLDEKYMLFVRGVELMSNLASLTFPSSMIWNESLKNREGSRSPYESVSLLLWSIK